VSVAGRQRRRKVRPAGSARSEGGIILPNGVVPPRAAQLLVPRGYEDPEPPVMVGVCHTCDARFYRGQEEDWQRHVGDCARAHLGEIMAARAEHKKRMAVFDDDSWDPEIRQHMDKVGERMKREGRLVVRPNERAGFS
jgi:hypothetical protein